jgi:site-specific recombinase XerC
MPGRSIPEKVLCVTDSPSSQRDIRERALFVPACQKRQPARSASVALSSSSATPSSESPDRSRYTAGQRVLDAASNLKAVQALLGHSSISTTADIYTDWDVQQLEGSLRQTFAAEDGEE